MSYDAGLVSLYGFEVIGPPRPSYLFPFDDDDCDELQITWTISV